MYTGDFAMSDDEGKPPRLVDSRPEPDKAPRLCVTLMLRGAYKDEVVAKALEQARQVRRDRET